MQRTSRIGRRYGSGWDGRRPRHFVGNQTGGLPDAAGVSPYDDRAPETADVQVAVVIPCYRVTQQILGVLRQIGPDVARIYCVDDACPDGTGDLIEKTYGVGRITVIRHEKNIGVGGATLSGYSAAIEDGADIIVKIDGDGQMDARLIPNFVRPIQDGWADYVKGNRFANLEDPKSMPALRLFGNSALSFLTKLSSGYWNIFDPTNGYTAIHSDVARRIAKRPLARRYFFESDILHHLNMMRAVVTDMPMKARYGNEESNLRIGRVLLPFAYRHLRNAVRRIALQYFLRDFSLASLELLIGVGALTFGVTFGIRGWIESSETLEPATAGTVMVAALPVIVGVQLLLNAINYDIQNVPRVPLHVLSNGQQR